MTQAKNGDTVRIHYTGRLNDGTVFDSSRDRDPLEFTLGEGQVIPGFEDAVLGMSEGQEKTAEISAEDAYGPRRDDLVMEMPKERLPDDLDPSVGERLQMRTANGQTVEVLVTEVDDAGIRIDANHPLAGKNLEFEIEMVDVAS